MILLSLKCVPYVTAGLRRRAIYTVYVGTQPHRLIYLDVFTHLVSFLFSFWNNMMIQKEWLLNKHT